MKKFQFKVSALLITSFLILIVVGCGSKSKNVSGIPDTDVVAADAESLEVSLGGTDVDLNNVTTSLPLLLVGDSGSTITWSSSNPIVLADNGTVTRPAFTSGDATITLTATITKGAVTETKIFTIIVLKNPVTDIEIVDADMANVVDATLLGTGSTAGTDVNHVTGNLTLPATGSGGSTISWSSNKLTVIANNGTVTLPSGANSTVVLTATFTKGSVVETKEFTVIVLKYDFNVTFDSRGGSTVSLQLIASGGLVAKPSEPSLDDNAFSGWYTEAACTTPWNFTSDTVTGDVTLYAKWTAATATGINYTLIASGTEYQVSKGGPSFSGDVIIPGSHAGLPVTAIAVSMFEGDTGLTSLVLPNTIKTIGNRAFYGATGLTSITLPTSLTIIGERAFYHCTGLTSISIPAGVTILGLDTFYECTGLTSLTLPAGLTSIGVGAIRYCSNLTTITIPNGVTSIGDYAFGDDSKLTTITIPGSVTTIGGLVFQNCTLLANVVVNPSAVPTSGDQIFGNCPALVSIIVPVASQTAYREHVKWDPYKLLINP